MTDARPVWLTREQRDSGDSALLDTVLAAWDAAPADAEAVVKRALIESTDLPADERRLAVAKVLAALGYPKETHD